MLFALGDQEKNSRINEFFIGFLIIIFCSAYLLFLSNFGFNLWIYLFCFIFAGIFILFYPTAGLYAIIFLTVVFERIFTLSTIVINQSTIKFYPLDLLIIITSVSGFIHYFFSTKNVGTRNGMSLRSMRGLLISAGEIGRAHV